MSFSGDGDGLGRGDGTSIQCFPTEEARRHFYEIGEVRYDLARANSQVRYLQSQLDKILAARAKRKLKRVARKAAAENS